MDTAREIVKKLSPSPRIDAPRARTRRLNLRRASRRLQTIGVWWKRTTSKKGRRRQPPFALHWERNARQRNKLHPKAATTKTKRGLALYVASLVCGEPCMWRALYVTSLVCNESCMWRALYVTSLVCGEHCMWRALYVASLVYGEPCMWRALYVTSLVCGEPCM